MTRFFLVTGGTGFLGAALVRRLLGAGHRVRVLDNNSRGSLRRLEDVAGKFEMVVGDIRDERVVLSAVEGTDAVLHLAAINGTEFFYSKPQLVLDVGVRGILNVVSACQERGIKDLVVASSSEVYQLPPKIPTDESVPLVVPDVTNPRYSYGGSKIISELIAINAGRQHFDRVAVFRPHNVYGADMGWEHVIPQFACALASSPETSEPTRFPIQGTGTEKRAFIHIDDFTTALMLVIERGVHLGIYHLGTQEEVAMADLAHLVAQALGRRITLDHKPLQAGSVPRRVPDVSKLAALGFRPQHTLATGLPGVVNWYKNHLHLWAGGQN